MPIRSWTAALTFAAATLAGVTTPVRAGEQPVINEVKLKLQIAGLGRDGCEVEVKPGHAGCRFEAVIKKIEHRGPGDRQAIDLDPFRAESHSADRDCAFAITIREPGRPPKTYRRGLRLAATAAGRPVPTQSLTCYLSTPSLVARQEAARAQR